MPPRGHPFSPKTRDAAWFSLTVICGLVSLAAFSGCRTRPGQIPVPPATTIGQNHVRHAGASATQNPQPKTTAPKSAAKDIPPTTPPRATRPANTSSVETAASPLATDALPSAPQAVTINPPPSASETAASFPKVSSQTGRVLLVVPPAAPLAPRAVARLGLGETSPATVASHGLPPPVGLSCLVTGAPTMASAPRLTIALPPPSPAALPSANGQPQPFDLFSRFASTRVGPGSSNQQASLHPSFDAAKRYAPTARFDQTALLPLPDTGVIALQSGTEPVVDAFNLSVWLSDPVLSRPSESPSAQAERARLHDKVYNILLGSP